LNHGNAKIRHRVLVGFLNKLAFGFLFPKERGNLVADDLKNQAQVLADQFIIFRNLISDCSEWTAATHVETSLQSDLGAEPLFQASPGLDPIAQLGRAVPDGVQMALKNLVYQALLVLEIVIELALSGA